MEKKKVDLGAVAAEAGKNAKAFWGKAKETIVSVADQNDDGSLDFKDVSVIAESIGNAAKNAAVSAISSAEEKSRELEKKLLQPVFVEDLDDADFLISRFAPTDMLLQRIGRLWRHPNTLRPESSRNEVWIIDSDLDETIKSKGSCLGLTSYIYTPYVLCRSLEVWKDLFGEH